MSKSLDDILFRPCLTKIDEQEVLVIPFLKQTITNSYINENIQRIDAENCILCLLLVEDTIDTQSVCTEDVNIPSDANIEQLFLEVEEDNLGNKVFALSNTITQNTSNLLSRVSLLNHANSAVSGILSRLAKQNEENIKLLSSDGEDDENGSLGFLAQDQEQGEYCGDDIILIPKRNIKLTEVKRVWNAVNKVIQENASIDLANEEAIEQLRKDIEYAACDALPKDIPMGDCDIDMEHVKQRIELIRENEED